jgi:hypothetical protein
MGKTLISVLEVAAVVAVQAIPGIGQAVGVALGVSAAAGTAIATAAVLVTEYGLNAVLAKSPKAPQTETSIKSPRPVRMSAYCEMRASLGVIL